MEINNLNFFIGYDSKEDIAYRVCKNSLLRKSSINLKIISLKIDELIAKNFYHRAKDPLASTEYIKSLISKEIINELLKTAKTKISIIDV